METAFVVAQNILCDEHFVTKIAREDQVCCDDLLIYSFEVAPVGKMNVVQQAHESLVGAVTEFALKLVLGLVIRFNFQFFELLHFVKP